MGRIFRCKPGKQDCGNPSLVVWDIWDRDDESRRNAMMAVFKNTLKGD